jgi:hypothetical protein
LALRSAGKIDAVKGSRGAVKARGAIKGHNRIHTERREASTSPASPLSVY